ncbi:MAG: dihydrolipoamide acetyltransferase family protein [Acidimicrobiia bacterium]
MLHEFKLPDIGEGLTEAEIVSWFVDEGEAIAVADLVVEVETAKTTVEIPSPHAGVLSKRFGEEGDTVEVGAVLFVVETADVPTSESDSMPEPATPAPDPEPSTAASVAPELRAGERSTGVRAVPAVRKLAKDLGVELATVVGTGPNGAITRDDVTTAASGPESDTMVPLSSVRRAIAANMTESWTTIPHVTVQAEVRAEALLAALGNGTPIEASVATAVLPLLVEFPAFNSRYEDDGILHRSVHNLGFAVDTDAGLLVAVVKDADTLDQADLATEINRVQGAARSGNLTPNEATGQTFTISNIGALGGGHGTPIIPMGTSAIVSIGRATEQPIVEAGTIEVAMIAPIDLSYDHRIIDGGLGQRFLSALVTNLETPLSASQQEE